MGKSGANPSEEVPVLGYPPPPPPNSGDGEGKPVSLLENCFAMAFIISIAGLFVYWLSRVDFPIFQLDYVSVSVHNNKTTTAEWDIGFSIVYGPVNDLEVWTRFIDRDFKVESPGSVGNWTVSFSTVFPSINLQGAGLIALEHLVFKCKYTDNYVLMYECQDVVIRVSSLNDSTMIMKGIQTLCPVIYQDELKH